MGGEVQMFRVARHIWGELELQVLLMSLARHCLQVQIQIVRPWNYSQSDGLTNALEDTPYSWQQAPPSQHTHSPQGVNNNQQRGALMDKHSHGERQHSCYGGQGSRKDSPKRQCHVLQEQALCGVQQWDWLWCARV